MKDMRPPGKKGKLVWKDETAKIVHEANVKRNVETPYFIYENDLSDKMNSALSKGPGTSFIMKVSFASTEEPGKRIFQLLQLAYSDQKAPYHTLFFPAGTVAMYLGQARSEEARYGNIRNENGSMRTNVLAVRHVFLVGGARVIISPLDEQFITPLDE